MTDRPLQLHATEAARAAQRGFHSGVVEQVAAAITLHDVVVVGMSLNPHCKKAREALDAAGIAHRYLEFGGYTSKWKERLALKMWCGWPTFPQVFIKGVLVGGNSDLRSALANGTVEKLLEG